MAISPTMITAIGGGLKALVSGLYDPNKKMRKYFQGQLPGYAQGLERGITPGDLMEIQGNLQQAAMPEINALSSSFSSRLGQSGYAKGALMSQYAKLLANPLADLQRFRLANNEENKRALYSTAAKGSLK